MGMSCGEKYITDTIESVDMERAKNKSQKKAREKM